MRNNATYICVFIYQPIEVTCTSSSYMVLRLVHILLCLYNLDLMNNRCRFLKFISTECMLRMLLFKEVTMKTFGSDVVLNLLLTRKIDGLLPFTGSCMQ